MPWKNGLGATREIAVHPEGAAAWTWRLSIAEVGASGPFSSFPGIDRTIVQLEGGAMTLSHEGRAERLRRLRPFRFSGDLATHCALEGAPARDFNVMVRREHASAEVEAHELVGGAWAALSAADAETSAVHVVVGWASVEVGGADMRVERGETLLLGDGLPRRLTAGTGGAAVILVAFGR
jgi:environmental stress-induced protein Ves